MTVGDELRKERIDRQLKQHQVAQLLKVNRNFIYELELSKRKLTIFALYKVYLFLGYIPETLNINDSTLQGKFFAHRIRNQLNYSKLSKQIDLDKSTLIRFTYNKPIKEETKLKIIEFLNINYEK